MFLHSDQTSYQFGSDVAKIFVTFTYNMSNTPNLGKYSPYELTFGRKPKVLMNLETTQILK